MNIALTRAADGLPRRAFTIEDIRRMVEAGVIGENERIELVEGDLVMMAAKGYAHEMVKKALIRALVTAAPDDVYVEATIQFAENTLLEPDLAVIPQPRVIKSDAGFVAVDRGGCLLVIEVASSSLGYDRGPKAKLYAGFGVREFRVVDQRAYHLGPHRSERERLVVDRRARSRRDLDHPCAAWLCDQARRDLIIPRPGGRVPAVG
jgi:Uma2 family endonuclease